MPFSSNYDIFPTVTAWTNPVKLSSPDYLNDCADVSSGLRIPYSTFGYQQPKAGSAYAGIIAFQGQYTSGNLTYDYREYLQNKLPQAMIAGRQYCVSFYVSPTISTAFNFNYVGLEEIGINFSPSRPLDSLKYSISLPYHIKNNQGNYLTDTSKWYKVSGVYQATGGENWLTLGCFGNGAGSAPSFVNIYPATPNPNLLYWTYLFIDEVSVSEITSADTIRNTHDTLVCKATGLSILMKGASAATSYNWSTGATTSQLMAHDTGTYWCAAKMECGLITDTFHIRYRPYRRLDLGRDTFNCTAQPVIISSNNNYLSYQWSTGASAQAITVNQTGEYILTVHDTCGSQTDTIKIVIQDPTPPPVVRDTTICQYVPSPNLVVDGVNLTWYLPNTIVGIPYQPFIYTVQPGNQTLYVSQTIGYCESPQVPIHIKVKYKPKADIGDYYTLCKGLDTIIGKEYPEVTYLWNTNEQVCCIQPRETGTYELTIMNECGKSSDTAYVELSPCDECLLMPTAFTPNNDGRNDVFSPIIKCPVADYRLTIFSRWGELLFSSEDPGLGWNGRNKEDKADVGTYIYMMEYRSVNTYSRKFLKGNVTLIR